MAAARPPCCARSPCWCPPKPARSPGKAPMSPPIAARAVRTLSAGQRRRVALARVVAADAPLWLLDEPLNALDAESQDALRVILESHLGDDGLAIAATHMPLQIRGARTLDLRP